MTFCSKSDPISILCSDSCDVKITKKVIENAAMHRLIGKDIG